MVVSNLLLLYFHDITAFRVVFTAGIISLLMLVFSDVIGQTLTYFATVLLIVSIGGWLNINLLIMELRVPPENVAAVQLMTRTMANASAILAPTVASLPAPIPYFVLFTVSFCGFMASLFLPAPGHHLPKIVPEVDAASVEEHSVKVQERGSQDLSYFNPNALEKEKHIVKPTPLFQHSMSHAETFTERKLQALRPMLSVNRRDSQVHYLA